MESNSGGAPSRVTADSEPGEQTLAERVAALRGPDRRTDALIACRFVFRGLRPAEPDDFNGEFGYSPGNIKVEHGFLMAASFTRSFDAVLDILPEAAPEWHIGGLRWCGDGRWHAELRCWRERSYGWGANPALALLSAIFSTPQCSVGTYP
jgi:hypothetical protein